MPANPAKRQMPSSTNLSWKPAIDHQISSANQSSNTQCIVAEHQPSNHHRRPTKPAPHSSSRNRSPLDRLRGEKFIKTADIAQPGGCDFHRGDMRGGKQAVTREISEMQSKPVPPPWPWHHLHPGTTELNHCHVPGPCLEINGPSPCGSWVSLPGATKQNTPLMPSFTAWSMPLMGSSSCPELPVQKPAAGRQAPRIQWRHHPEIPGSL